LEAASPEKQARRKELASAWQRAHLELWRTHKQNRNAKKRGNGGTLSRGLSEKLFKLQGGKCACCALPLGKNFHLDHIMPIALGGPNIDSNIQLLRPRCNIQKKAKHPVDFMQSRGFLL
jgi:5-methylcytosine-specific restriction endonuclease McrA